MTNSCQYIHIPVLDFLPANIPIVLVAGQGAAFNYIQKMKSQSLFTMNEYLFCFSNEVKLLEKHLKTRNVLITKQKANQIKLLSVNKQNLSEASSYNLEIRN